MKHKNAHYVTTVLCLSADYASLSRTMGLNFGNLIRNSLNFLLEFFQLTINGFDLIKFYFIGVRVTIFLRLTISIANVLLFC